MTGEQKYARAYTSWLLPSQPLRSLLRLRIEQLAEIRNSVAFDPHVTLSCNPSSDAESIALAKKICATFAPVILEPLQIEQSDKFSKTLFIQFAKSAQAHGISDLIAKESRYYSGYTLNPHLSLLYKTMSATERAALARMQDMPVGEYLFDRLRVVTIDEPFHDPRQIKGWQTVFEAELNGI